MPARYTDTPSLRANLAHFQAMVWGAASDARLLELADALRRGISTDRAQVAARIHEYVSALTYIQPPAGVEYYVHPAQVIARGGGDCDNLTGLSIVLALMSGIPSRAVVIRTGAVGGAHMFPEFLVPNPMTGGAPAWLAFDPCIGVPRPGSAGHGADGKRLHVVEFVRRPVGLRVPGEKASMTSGAMSLGAKLRQWFKRGRVSKPVSA